MALKTLTEVIENQGTFNIRNVSVFSATDDMIYIDHTLYTKYSDFVWSIITTVETEVEDRKNYTFRPGLLSNRLYGSTELASLLIMINNCESPSDFKVKKTLNIILPDNLEYFFDSLVAQNQEMLEKNKLDVGIL